MVNRNQEQKATSVVMILLILCIVSFVIFVNYLVFGSSGVIITGVAIVLLASGNTSKLLES